MQACVRELGAAYSGELELGRTTHLVCHTVVGAFSQPKYLKALEWGIPVVSYCWLVDSMQVRRAHEGPCCSGAGAPLAIYEQGARTQRLSFALPCAFPPRPHRTYPPVMPGRAGPQAAAAGRV